ncbi:MULTISPECIES: DsbA family protein [Cycloclasticus]|uniref:Thioredoxin n=1 Tax=Cycloclasticus zancles 78-ME TaxID=1198232 RepID=S5TU04_9GAMM|nr:MULTISPECIES: DsbA family protein [Cycloclasticus]AFT66182.1 hypothetical protein Q91_0142 [Cycloclasticus sp. P1]AGS38490.1 Thioredoxin [Cycloclasticus zancles 78-ME]MBV1899396.1 DsbA family protein [Cycloclasticus sp.]
MDKVLYYVHDPMCSWCWAFNKTWAVIQSSLPSSIEVRYLLGGLAPDSDQPMATDLQEKISDGWYRIQQHVPGTEFNHNFWTLCKPRRSTYPSCRALIAARMLDRAAEKPMLLAIQQAYYLHAKNPADDEVLIECAGEIGLDESEFSALLNHSSTQQQLLMEIKLARSMGASSFPSIVLQQSEQNRLLRYDYNDPQVLLNQLS